MAEKMAFMAKSMSAQAVKAESVKAEVEASCFTQDARFKVRYRPKTLASQIQVGDRLKTLDGAYQAVRLIYKMPTQATGRNAPIRFEPGAIGNSSAITLSQRHRIYTGSIPNFNARKSDRLIEARALLGLVDASLQETGQPVIYYHFLLDEHQLLWANGMYSESWQPKRKYLISNAELATTNQWAAPFPNIRKPIPSHKIQGFFPQKAPLTL